MLSTAVFVYTGDRKSLLQPCRWTRIRSLHFALVVDDTNVVTRVSVCVCVCLPVSMSVRGRMPTLLHGPGCNLGEW